MLFIYWLLLKYSHFNVFAFFFHFTPSNEIIPLEHKGLLRGRENEKTSDVNGQKRIGFWKTEDDD